MGVDLSIVIVNWNGRGFLPDCLRSIVENPPKVSYEIVVVDNASSDGSVEWMKSAEARELLGDSQFRLIESSENLGFGRANNLAFEQTDSKFVFVLNPDSLVSAGGMDKLIETLELNDTIGMTAPKLIDEHGVVSASVMPSHPTPLSIIVEGFKFDRILPKRLTRDWLFAGNWDYDLRHAVPVVAGAAMMCKRQMIDGVGGFDEKIFMYGEDLEWCVRINQRGWKIYFEPKAEIVHICGKSSAQRWNDDEVALLQERAAVRFQLRCFSPVLNISNSLTKIFVTGLHLIRWKTGGRNTQLLRQIISLHVRNCKRILSGRTNTVGAEERLLDSK